MFKIWAYYNYITENSFCFSNLLYLFILFIYLFRLSGHKDPAYNPQKFGFTKTVSSSFYSSSVSLTKIYSHWPIIQQNNLLKYFSIQPCILFWCSRNAGFNWKETIFNWIWGIGNWILVFDLYGIFYAIWYSLSCTVVILRNERWVKTTTKPVERIWTWKQLIIHPRFFSHSLTNPIS